MFLLIYNILKAKEKKFGRAIQEKSKKNVCAFIYVDQKKKTYIYLLSFTVMKVLELLHADNGCQICG